MSCLMIDFCQRFVHLESSLKYCSPCPTPSSPAVPSFPTILSSLSLWQWFRQIRSAQIQGEVVFGPRRQTFRAIQPTECHPRSLYAPKASCMTSASLDL